MRKDKYVAGCGLDSSGSGYGAEVGCSELSSELSVSMRYSEFLDQLGKC
jgi:hypothetical protein